MKIYLLPLFLAFFLLGCSSSKKTTASQAISTAQEPEVIEEFHDMDTMVVSAAKPNDLKSPEDFKLSTYHPSFQLKSDLVHTRLELSFDWAKQHVLGKAVLSLKPYFYPSRQLTLDAIGFDLHKVSFEGASQELKYEYNGAKIVIDLGRTIPANETYKIQIEYTAKPTETPSGGSAAITSEQGLFFINHDNSVPNKPMQIWTQGETENNSRWFPTVDKPNERCTQEIYLTVAEKFKTLSNGTLISSTPNNNGTRTDYWKMDQPHAPYLFMLAIGEFSVVKDEYKGKPVEYYVEPKYEAHARAIYRNTLPMLKFFSEKLDYDYPWDKYSQVTVRDYVSGAMENTTGVIFGEFMHGTERELIDVAINETIVAHEMFHHWFGDLVTCESWANLTMNEGFANYGEALWLEHRYGKDEADRHLFEELTAYMDEAGQRMHPLIHFSYNSREDMFDSHSYSKGGLVLHMLRNYIGDEAFWAGLSLYLKTHEYTAVESHDLRLAFEDVTGEDLNWFFNQWYFNAGHPILNIQHDYDATRGVASIEVEQIQDPDRNPPIFILPLAVDLYDKQGNARREHIRIDKRIQTFEFKVDEKPALVNFDADKILIGEKHEEKTEEELIFQYKNTPRYLDRQEALVALTQSSSAAAQQTIAEALNDSFWSLRRGAINNIKDDSPAILDKMAQLATNDPKSQVRAAAVTVLGMTKNEKYVSILKKALTSDRAYPVISSALGALNDINSKEALSQAAKLESEENINIITSIANVYAQNPNPDHLSFYEKKWGKVDGYPVMSFFGAYTAVLQQLDDVNVLPTLPKLSALAKNSKNSLWKRFAATKTLNDLREGFKEQIADSDASRQEELKTNITEITGLIEEIKTQETDPQLTGVYSNF